MTVAELIERLQRFESKLEVLIHIEDGEGDFFPLHAVEGDTACVPNLLYLVGYSGETRREDSYIDGTNV